MPIKNACQDSDRNSPSKLVIETLREELLDRNLCLTIFGQVLNYKFINKKNKTMCFKWNFFLKNIYTYVKQKWCVYDLCPELP